MYSLKKVDKTFVHTIYYNEIEITNKSETLYEPLSDYKPFLVPTSCKRLLNFVFKNLCFSLAFKYMNICCFVLHIL